MLNIARMISRIDNYGMVGNWTAADFTNFTQPLPHLYIEIFSVMPFQIWVKFFSGSKSMVSRANINSMPDRWSWFFVQERTWEWSEHLRRIWIVYFFAKLVCSFQLTLPLSTVRGSELTSEPYRWDQRVFSLVLQMHGAGETVENSSQAGVPISDNRALNDLCEVTGGECVYFYDERKSSWMFFDLA